MKALVAAATPLVGRFGASGVSTRAIAQAAGVNQGLITRYFGSKEALVREVANAVAHRLFAQVVDRSLGLEDLLVGSGAGSDGSLRVLIRILLDEETRGGLVDPGLVRRVLDWLGREAGGSGSLHARVYLVASLILGSELVAPNLGLDLGVTDEELKQVRKEAVELFLRGLGTAP